MTATADLTATLTAAGIDTITDRRAEGVLVASLSPSRTSITATHDNFRLGRTLIAQISTALRAGGYAVEQVDEYRLEITGKVSCFRCGTEILEDEALPLSGGSYACEGCEVGV